MYVLSYLLSHTPFLPLSSLPVSSLPLSLSLAPLSFTQDLARRLHEEEKQAARRHSQRQPQQPHPQDAVSSLDQHKHVLHVADVLCFTFGESLDYKASLILLVCHLSFFLLLLLHSFTLIPSSLHHLSVLSSLHPGPSQETPRGGNASC